MPADSDAALREWVRTWANIHPRRGFRSAYWDACGEGFVVNHRTIQRLRREEGLWMPQRRRLKRTGTSTALDLPAADAPNRVWAMDFQFDATTDGRPIKIVSVVDERTRECLGGLVQGRSPPSSSSTSWTAWQPSGVTPAGAARDNGPELACEAIADWAGKRVGLSFIPPAEPWRNGYAESFDSRVHDECMNINILWSLPQAQVVIGDWKDDYNQRRRHSSRAYQAPAVYAADCTHR